MAKGSSKFAATKRIEEDAGEYRRVRGPTSIEAERRVLVMQTKLHQWAIRPILAVASMTCANLVYDPAFLVVAWNRVRGNKGARTAGVDGVAPRSIVLGAARTARRAAR